MLFTRRPYIDLALLLCLTLLLSQIALAQQAPKFTGDAWSQFSVNGEIVGAKAVCDDADIDNDNDGLIEICNLEGLNAIRNNRSGSGNQAQGCPSGGCNGYELVRDLDFTVNDSYSSSASKGEYTVGDYTDSADNGWLPIGNHSLNFFNSIFEGNGHTISNLMINRSSITNIGLFGRIGSSSKISNIGLLNVDIRGHENVGA